jgi:hypothetical protein
MKYTTGCTNHVVDCLSRPPVSSLTMMLHSCRHEASEWPQIYKSDLEFSTTYQLLGTCATVIEFHLQDRLLCHFSHLCVPLINRAKLFWEAHYSWMAGHFGMENIVVVLQKNFYWPKLQQDVNKYMRSYIACAIAKPTTKKQGLYNPFPTADRPWESISMEYMYDIPSTKQGSDCVFFGVEWFSKMTILTTYRKSITTKATANIFFERVWVHFGIPQTIISDWDNSFLSTFWSSLWSLLDTKLTKSIPFHP